MRVENRTRRNRVLIMFAGQPAALLGIRSIQVLSMGLRLLNLRIFHAGVQVGAGDSEKGCFVVFRALRFP
jgi:hypothetical protein